MPTYQFECRKANAGCGHIFTEFCTIAELDTLEPRCPGCKKRKSVFRDYNVRQFAFGPNKTVGSLADKNAREFSSDMKKHLTEKNSEYKKQEFVGKLPEGGSTYKRDGDGNRIPRS